jgi:UDP-glucose 4-epimerase
LKVAVTGANGFLGRHLVPVLSRLYTVVAIGRKSTRDSSLASLAVETDYSFDDLVEKFSGCETLIHLAAARPYRGDESSFQNVLLDFRVFAAAKSAGIKHIIFTSSRAVYGSQPVPWTENTRLSPDSVYGLCKAQSELTAEFFSRQGISVTRLRLAQIFGDGEFEGGMVSTFLNDARAGKPLILAATGMRREYIYVNDLIDAFLAILEQPPFNGVFNLGSDESVCLEQIATAILRAFGRDDDELIRAENIKKLNENSLMNSQHFRDTFCWQPKFSFSDAAADIARHKKSFQER